MIQGSDELPQGNYPSGAPYAGLRVPGLGVSGGLGWQTIPSGTFAITAQTQKFCLNFTDVGFAFIRPAFNVTGGATGGNFASSATGTSGGSGTMLLYLTGKNT